jgi:hypothetical protein
MARTALCLVIALTVSAAPAFAIPESDSSDLAGVYQCRGMNPDGTPYEGVVEIARIADTYRVHWRLSNNVNVIGVGIYSGGVFAVSYFGGAPGVVVYRIDGSRLVGEWTMGGAEGTIYTETLTRVAAGTVEPRREEPQRRPAPAAGRQVLVGYPQ